MKDALERKLHKLVCAGQLDLEDRLTRDSVRLDRSVQEICWPYAFAGSNPALSKSCIRAESQPPELISRHLANKNKLLSLYPIIETSRSFRWPASARCF